MKICNLKATHKAALVLLSGVITSTATHAGDGWFENSSVSISGFIRAEVAGSNSGEENPNNQGGNVFNDKTVQRDTFLPPALNPLTVVNPVTGLLGLGGGGGVGAWGTTPLPFGNTVRRGDFVKSTDNDFNYALVRTEIELNFQLNYEWRFIARLRGLFDPEVYDAFDANDLSSFQNGRDAGPHTDAGLYEGKPSYFDYIDDTGKNPNSLEWTSNNYQLYFPTFLFEYASGDLSIRAGNQQIAWGQAVFFRIFDVPNGLDLRRHSLLDRGLEEFSDKRVPMLSLRATYQVTNNILADAYVGRFQPTVYGNPNTPYNIIPTQFTVRDTYGSGDYDEKLSGGFRLKGDYGQFGWQASFVTKYGTEGTFAWTKSGVSKPLTGLLGDVVNTAYNAKLSNCAVYDPILCRKFGDSGEALANSPFSVNPGGVYSADEWFHYAAAARLDAVAALNSAITEFDGSMDIYASSAANVGEAEAQLNTFFTAAGGSMSGHLERRYHRENIFALGASYVNESENNFLNQLIFNVEVQYAHNRGFTSPSLSQKEIREDEYTAALVVDKWHRFFDDIPGTYIVFQALTKNKSDLVGRHLSGYGAVGRDELEAGSTTGLKYKKKGNANYIVFGFTQPLANKIVEIELVSLLDMDGGLLVQPGIRWNPGSGLTVEAFYNHIDGDMWGDTPNSNLLSSLDFADELSLRLTYQF
jgi:hypothetical protein